MNNILTKSGRISLVFALTMLLAFSASAQITLRTAVDTDGDGKADISVFRPTDNTWNILSNGNVRIQEFGIASEDRLAPGDFDGDGKGDISVWRDNGGVFFRLNSSDNTFAAYQFGSAGDEPVARDYDGDGITNFAAVRRANGVMTWMIAFSVGNFTPTVWGVDTDLIAPGDYDGDGKFDIAVRRPGTTATGGIFMIIRSSDNVLAGFQWGTPTDFFAPGDYDGDGATDLAVVREGTTPDSPLVWYILMTGGGVRTQTWGITQTDEIVQNDYDGDGKTDIAIWRRTDGTFQFIRSSDGVLAGFQWGSGNDMPIAGYDTH